MLVWCVLIVQPQLLSAACSDAGNVAAAGVCGVEVDAPAEPSMLS
jgi:hypothetical protein